MGYKKDLSNQRFGKIVVLSYSHSDSRRKSYWLCQCDCGSQKVICGSNLNSGNTVSCGCVELENRRLRMKSFEDKYYRHGQCYSRLYDILRHMKQRCLNPNNKDYGLYGGRGISICDEWLGQNGFESFRNWAMNNGYSDDLSIDRIDVNGNYEPSNCRWTTAKTQANNRRTNLCYLIDGETKTLAEWCKTFGKNYGTIYYRINKMKMPIKEALEK